MNVIDRSQEPHGGITDPHLLRELYGCRWHHFHDVKGRLVATIVSEPIDSVNEAGEPLVAVAAAICSKKDSPSRFRGRAIALGRLETGSDVEVFSLDVLKEQITNRTILKNFRGGERLKLRPRGEFVPRSPR